MVLMPSSLAHRCHVLHGRVVVGGEHEADAHLRRCKRAMASGARLMLMPRRLHHIRTAALAADTLRPPCLLTLAPAAAAATNIEQVEMLKVCDPSPPVPTMSTRCVLSATWTLVENSRMTWAAAVISPMVSFLTRKPVIKRRHHDRRQLAPHDQPHHMQHLVVEDLAVLDRALSAPPAGLILWLWGMEVSSVGQVAGLLGQGQADPEIAMNRAPAPAAQAVHAVRCSPHSRGRQPNQPAPQP